MAKPIELSRKERKQLSKGCRKIHSATANVISGTPEEPATCEELLELIASLEADLNAVQEIYNAQCT